MVFPELVGQAVRAEKTGQPDKQSIKFLDHFCLKYSVQLETMIQDKKNVFDLERYFLRQQIERIGTEDLEEDEK